MITGEQVEMRCDYIVASRATFEYNPYVQHRIDNWIDTEKTYEIENPIDSTIFVYSHELHLRKVLNTLKQFKNPFRLVLHNSDHTFDESLLPILALVPNIRAIYTQNCCVAHSRVFPIPIGFQNRMWWSTPNDLALYEAHTNTEKTRDVYFNFSIQTNAEERQRCKDILERKGFVWSKTRPFVEYVPYLATHRFCICPVGNGLDTHRYWEAIALRVIPVCLHNPVTVFYAQYLPIVLLNDWEELTREVLEGLQGVDWSNADTLLSVENWDLFGRA